MNRLGRIVLALLALFLLFALIAISRGQIDGAAVLAAFSLSYAIAITAWACTNRKRTQS